MPADSGDLNGNGSDSMRNTQPIENLEARRLFAIILGADLHRASFIDSSGDTVVVSLAGPGQAAITLASDSAGDITGLTFTDTTWRSSFAVTTKAKTLTTIGDVTVNGSLKALTAKGTDLDGDITVTGTLGSIWLHDVDGSSTIDIQSVGKTSRAQFNFADNLMLKSAGEFGTVIAGRWVSVDPTNTGIKASRVGRLQIAGDFGANLILSDTASIGLGSAVIGGSIGNSTWRLAGDARSISVKGEAFAWKLKIANNLTSSLSIRGALSGDNAIDIGQSAKAIRLGSPVTLVAPVDVPVTQIHVGGKACVISPGQKPLRFSGARVFSNSAISYSLAELQNSQVENRQWTYATYFRGPGTSGANSTVTKVSSVIANAGTGEAQSVLSTTVDDVTTDLKWLHTDTGSYLSGWSVQTADGNFNLSFSPLHIADADWTLGDKVVSTAEMVGDFSATNGVTLTGEISGKAQSISRFIGHEEVVTPAGRYLAARLAISLTLTGTMDINVGNAIRHVKFRALQNQSVWLSPGVGPVRNITSWKISAGFAGGGSSGSSFSTEQLLESWS